MSAVMDERLQERVLLFKDDVDSDTLKTITLLERSGNAVWEWDPFHEGVCALVWADTPTKAIVVMYADGDWEMTTDFRDGTDD